MFEFLSGLKDPRRKQGQRHTLQNIFVIVIMAILSGHQGLRGFARFAQANAEELGEVLGLKHGVPCYHTFRQVFNALNEQLVAQQFMTWMRSYHADMGDNFIALDGKSVRSSVSGGNTKLQNFISVVSAFGHQSGMVYGMGSFENGKGGERPALQQLLAALGISDKVFTMDAAHSNKKTLDLILEMQGHFLVQVKRNCRKLWETIALYTALAQPISRCEYYQSEHGRETYRRVEVYENHAHLPKGWNGILRLVKVRRWGTRGGKRFEEVAFYVLSKPLNSAVGVGRAIQEHWGVENNLHWVKDVNLGEDHTTIKGKNMVSLLVYMNNAAMNTLVAAGYKPTKDTFAKFANKVNQLIKLFKNSS